MKPTAIILAAGSGSRLLPYTADRPKCLVDLNGRPLIEWHLKVLHRLGISNIILVTGYRGEMLNDFGCRTITNPDWEHTNMVETLFCAESFFSEDMIVAYADIFYTADVLQTLLESTHDISVVVDTGWQSYWESRFECPLSDAESLRMNDTGRILEIGQDVTSTDEIEGQYIGLMRFCGNGVQKLKDAKHFLGTTKRPWMDQRPVQKAYMTDLLTELIERNITLSAVPIDRNWVEIDSVHDYEIAQHITKNWVHALSKA